MTLRELVERSNATCKRLVREEDGVVLGVMVVTLMSLFLMAAATFAVGEHIRDRIEIQNAVDAAAYSAAVVEADAISRVAAINQAMAWTYIQMCREHMDAVLDRWLEYVAREYRKDERQLQSHYNSHFSANQFCGYWRNKDWGIGYPSAQVGKGQNNQISFNDGSCVRSISQVEKDAQAKDYRQLELQVEKYETNLKAMAQAQKGIINGIRRMMTDAAKQVMRTNGIAAEDQVTVITADATKYFHIYGERNDPSDEIKGEPDFLATIGTSGDKAFESGAHDGEWFALQSAQPWRKYVQRNNMLKAEWYGFSEGFTSTWFHGGQYGCQQLHGSYWNRIQVNRLLRGQDIIGTFRPVMKVEPHRLSCLYFDGNKDQNGGVVVACARPVRHPFKLFIDNGGADGFYDAFKGADTNNPRYMMAVSAARAGYRDGSDGEYNPCNDMHSSSGLFNNSTNNLGQTDWDAVLIPVRHAWTGRPGGTWATGHEADVLKELWASNWTPIGGGATRTLSAANLPGADRMMKTDKNKLIWTGFGTRPEDFSKSLYH